ncbi:hypothetical protein Q5752_003848 [Cryptotrichosporon argae]
MANNNSGLLGILVQLVQLFCGGGKTSQQQSYPQEQQQQPYQAQQPYQQPQYQQQPSYPPQHQPWSQVASPHGQQQQSQQHGQQHQQHKPQHGNQHNNHHANGYAGAIPAGVVGPHHPGYQNQDLINATNEQYTALRNQARQEGDKAHACFAQSQQAYQSGDGARAHELSVQGKQHQQRQDELDEQASQWIYSENNTSSPPNTVDLHGLYVREALARTEAAIAAAQQSGAGELRVIVGKGIHSQGHVAKIKPAVEELMQKYNLAAHLDPQNTGVLIVDLTGRSGRRSIDAGGLVDEMSNGKEDCVIM